MTHIHFIRDSRSGRLRARTVSLRALAQRAAQSLAGKSAMRCAHGGSVNNSYGYPADSECAVVVALRRRADDVDIHVACYAAQAPANKITLGGAAAAAAGAREIWDHRYSDAARAQAKCALLVQARADIEYVLAGEPARIKRAERMARRKIPRSPSLAERLQARQLARLRELGVTADIRVQRGEPSVSSLDRGYGRRDGHILSYLDPPVAVVLPDCCGDTIRCLQIGRWGYDMRDLELVGYCPTGDHRDSETYLADQNQERRRMIYRACGDRIIDAMKLVLRHEDDYGRLYESEHGLIVRVVCPSTGAIYHLPVDRARTAHEAVARTFGLASAEYHPTIQS